MPEEDKKEEEKSTEEKIAQSTGADTSKYGKELEDEADQIIKDMYHSDDDADDKDDKDDKDEKDADDDKDDKDDKDDDSDKDDKDDDDDTNDADKDDKVKADKDTSVDDLLDKLNKSEKRVKDTRADHTRGRQELKEATTKTLELEDTIFSLRTKVEELTRSVQTKAEEKKTEKAITKDVGDLGKQLEAMKEVDPDLAKAMEPIITGLVGQISNLKSEIVDKEEKAQKKAEQDASDTHFSKLDKAHDGWEGMMKTPEFKEYLQGLSPREKRLALLDLKDGTAENIIEVFDGFVESQKDDTDETEDDDKKSEKLDKAKKNTNPKFNKSKDVNRGAKKMKFTRSDINNMSNSEYAKKEKEIDQAMSEGLIENR